MDYFHFTDEVYRKVCRATIVYLTEKHPELKFEKEDDMYKGTYKELKFCASVGGTPGKTGMNSGRTYKFDVTDIWESRWMQRFNYDRGHDKAADTKETKELVKIFSTGILGRGKAALDFLGNVLGGTVFKCGNDSHVWANDKMFDTHCDQIFLARIIDGNIVVEIL